MTRWSSLTNWSDNHFFYTERGKSDEPENTGINFQEV